MVLQPGRHLSIKRTLFESRIKQPHDPTRMHRQELGRIVQEVLPRQQ